jgi:hypothetical protein
MTVTAVQISSSRPATTTTDSRQPTRRAVPTDVVVIADICALTVDNERACNDDNPYR